MNNVIPFNPANLPAGAQKRMAQGKGIARHLSEGAAAPMDILSIQGKNFTEKVGGEPVVTPRPQYEFDVVILDGTPGIGKTYFIEPFQQGSMNPPDCWSLNGIKPDPQAPHIQSPTCRGCKWNVFGSRISTDRQGKQSKAKACGDSRRIALLPAYKLTPPDGSDPNPLLLRVPVTSLQPLKVYAQTLERMGILVNAVVTRLGFDTVAHPQLTFTVVGMLNDAQYSHVEYLLRPDPDNPELYLDDRVRRILEAPPPVDDIDPSEFAGQVITNRNQLPVVTPAAAVPSTSTQWVPAQPSVQVAVATAPTPVQDEVISLPDGKLYNTRTKEFVVPTPAAPTRPDTVIELPDGQLYDTATRSYWDEAKSEPVAKAPAPEPKALTPEVIQKSISEQAKAEPPAPTAGWKPAAGIVPGPGWRPPGSPPADAAEVPDFLRKGKVIDATANGGEAPKAEEKVEPKKRKAAPPVTDSAPSQAVETTAGDLEAMLEGLDLGRK